MNEIVQSVDNTFLMIVSISVVLLLGITAAMIFFVVRYRRSKHPEPALIDGNVWLEVTWTLIPLALVLAMFYYGYEGFALMRNVPEGAFEVKVTARMWDWSFEYPNGVKTEKLYVPVDRPIKLLLHSLDVIHSFYMPAFRVKEDVVPGKESYLWFKPQTLGPAEIFCAEYCGQRHSYMMSEVIVMEQEKFDAWYQGQAELEELDPGAAARRLFDQHDCMACHSFADETAGKTPLRGILGRATTVTVGTEQKEIVADEAYIRRAILEPDAEIVVGHTDEMPVPEDLNDEDLQRMVEYLKGLK